MWCPKRPVGELDEFLRDYYTDFALMLLHDLNHNALIVTLAEAPEQRFEGHKIRVIDNRNPSWYRALYAQQNNFRRDLSLASLHRITAGTDKPYAPAHTRSYKYDFVYRTLIHDGLLYGFTFHEGDMPANDTVRYAFGLDCLDSVPF